ncbi:RDD family protein [Veronia nyctiphanis]|uniref:RDD family protein n=1 Tax=Veronia nyctiphanis TaxID=1278244 RepID=A0A4Q0YTT1_9GAMM|nr:RDD family protein [Veronia nyctiphanis]RXJ71828.1 RDD family protein [Veronia nyctiphanis]RXJ72579.1 RDD family protein [Veronia nyctiphanis]
MDEESDNQHQHHYVGFFPRVVASLIDGVLMAIVTVPILYSVYGEQYLHSEKIFLGSTDMFVRVVLPFIVTILFWSYRAATPGKMVLSAKIVDAQTGLRPTTTQYVVRYLGYIIASVPFGLGLFWIAIDQRKQGWHDKLAGTLVIYSNKNKDNLSIFEG